MNRIDTEALRRLHAATTQGSWWEDEDGFVVAGSRDSCTTVAGARYVAEPEADANVEFIAVAHNQLPALLAELDRLYALEDSLSSLDRQAILDDLTNLRISE